MFFIYKLNFIGHEIYDIITKKDMIGHGHRYGWLYVIQEISSLETKYLCVDYIDRVFGWNCKNYIIDNEWFGFWHNPPNIPLWLDYNYTPSYIIKNQIFKKNSKKCKFIIVFSNYLKKYLENKSEIPIYNLYHPIPYVNIKWSYNLWLKKKQFILVGWWLRKCCLFFSIRVPKDWNKIWLYSDFYAFKYFRKEYKELYNGFILDIPKLSCLSKKDYDLCLISSIGFLFVYDTSVNNTLLEFIAYGTPFICNKHPSFVEYLGNDYPLYAENLNDINNIILNIEKNIIQLEKVSEYLITISNKYNIETFKNNLSIIIKQYTASIL